MRVGQDRSRMKIGRSIEEECPKLMGLSIRFQGKRAMEESKMAEVPQDYIKVWMDDLLLLENQFHRRKAQIAKRKLDLRPRKIRLNHQK